MARHTMTTPVVDLEDETTDDVHTNHVAMLTDAIEANGLNPAAGLFKKRVTPYEQNTSAFAGVVTTIWESRS